MNMDASNLNGAKDFPKVVAKPRLRGFVLWLKIALAVFALVVLQALPVSAQSPTPSPSPLNPCPTALMPGQALIPVPVIGSGDGKLLRGTIILGSENEWMPFRVPQTAPSDQSRSQCTPQFVRTFREFGATSTMASAPYGAYAKGQYALPRPGPTLRARIGDLVQLTFINQINASDFPYSIDRGETGEGGGCDESNAGYPGADKYPDCFHGSSTGNIHFHGTHTNPSSTGDNVLDVSPGNPDRWVVLDDADDGDPFISQNLPPITHVFDGPGSSVQATSAQWTFDGQNNGTLQEQFDNITVPAGGQVALLAAAHKPPVSAVAAFFAPTDLARWREANPFIRDYLDDLCGAEGLPVRSPILRVAQIDVPVLLVHGDRDENVSVEQTLAMTEALKSHGKEVETFIVPGGTHFFTEQQNAQARRKLFDFLRRHLNRS